MKWVLTGEGWEPIPICRGLVADSALFDPTGAIWNRAGHWPLFLQVGSGRSRTAAGSASRDVKWEKNKWWYESKRQKWGNWPWWIEHASEATYWAEGTYDGEVWWQTREQYTDEENYEYDKGWIRLYGRGAYFRSISRVAGQQEADRLQAMFPPSDEDDTAEEPPRTTPPPPAPKERFPGLDKKPTRAVPP